MCWSGEASTVLAVLGMASTAYAAYRKEPPVLYMSLFYFSLMEALQAYTYSVIGQCTDPGNQIATLLGYLHIAFQPFFIHAVSMYFVPPKVREKIMIPVYTLCFISAIVMLIQLYPFDWAGQCDPSRPLCGQHLCSVRGNWHIAWEVPSNSLGNWFVGMFFGSGFITYEIVAFIIPVLYGSWRFTAYHYILGPFMAQMLTSNVNEYPAVWCLLSIGLLMIVVKTPVRKILHVKQWPLWPKSWRQ